MPYGDANGQRLYYEIHGAGETLLCVGGLGTDVSGWRPQIPAWALHYRVVVFDNRDVGRSTYVSAPYGIQDLAADAIAFANTLGIERFHLIGNSMGGAIAQEVALAIPGRVHTLTLVVSYAAAGLWWREHVRLEIQLSPKKTDEELTDELMLLSLSEHSYEGLVGELETMRGLILAYPHHQLREGYVRQLQASATHDARDRLPSLRMPVHVIAAEQDRFVPVWKSRELAQLVPGARLSIIPGAAHSVNLERTREFNQLVLDFLASARR